MSAKRYFQLSFLWPVVLPAIILAPSGPVVPEWIGDICRVALVAAGIPYLLFAIAILVWSRNKGVSAIRRSTYLAPVILLPLLFVYLPFPIAFSGASYRSSPGELITWTFIYGGFIAIAVLMLGYAYVAVINFGFLILTSCGALEEDPPTTVEILRNCKLPPSPDAVPVHASDLPELSSIVPTPWTANPGQACSPYGFVGWDDEKLKGCTTGRPKIGQQPWKSPGASPGSTMQKPAKSLEAARVRPRVSETTATRITVKPPNPNRAMTSSHRGATKSTRKSRKVKVRSWRDPLLTASLAILVPLIILSAFAFCRHHWILRGHSGVNHPAAAYKTSGATERR